MAPKPSHGLEIVSTDQELIQAVVDKFIWNEFERLSEMKMPQRGEVQGGTS